ncbi:hypothetical protein [Geomonas sp.]|uniref:hypothetical protein n=1 Tax=Geomonas sp. TaxID=2651584 RepID=UPI002B470460|nr:hypothetical protein [Geomonas sp.]HJV34881.1 hypothetical protein [Geomonas sp.]
MIRLSVVLLSLLLFSLSGCVGLGKMLSQLPPELQMKEVGKTDSASPFAVSRDGKIAAVHEEEIEIISPDGHVVKTGKIVGQRPNILSFSHNGTLLLAALPTATGSSLRLLTLDGKVLAEATLPGRVTAALWRDNQQVEAAALNIRRSSDGTQLTSVLYDWDNSGTPLVTTLSAVTIHSDLSKLSDELLLNTLNLSLSPYGDEIAYSMMKDLPKFSPYQAVITRRIDSGSEHEVTRTSVGSGGPIYGPDGDTLLVGDSRSVTRRVTIPDGREIYAWPSQGSYPSMSPSGKYLFLDGHLYRDGQTLATFPKESRAEFLSNGSGLVLLYGSRLYLVSGLEDQAAAKPAANTKLLELRKLRSQGVISERDYRARRDKLKGQK